MSDTASRDPNRNMTIQGVSSADLSTPTNVAVDPNTKHLQTDSTVTIGTTGSWSVSKQTALTNTAVSVKSSAGTFGGYMTLYNPNTTATYIQVFDVASGSVTVGTTAPTYVITLPGVASASATGSAANLELVNGINHTTAITIAATTTPTGATAPANNIVGTFLYK